MVHRAQAVSPQQHASATDMLSALLAAEERLAAQLDAAREQAEGILGEARAAAQRMSAECATTIDRRVAELNARHAAALETELAGIAQHAARQAAAFEQLPEQRFNELVEHIVARVLETATDGAGAGTGAGARE